MFGLPRRFRRPRVAANGGSAGDRLASETANSRGPDAASARFAFHAARSGGQGRGNDAAPRRDLPDAPFARPADARPRRDAVSRP